MRSIIIDGGLPVALTSEIASPVGGLELASQLFAGERDAHRKVLVIFSDMRESTSCLDLEAAKVVPPFLSVTNRCGKTADLENVQTYVVGVDGAGKPTEYWQSLRNFWQAYFQNARADLRNYTVLREPPAALDMGR